MRLLLVIDDPEWTDPTPARSNQVFANRMNDRLKLIGERIANCGQTSGDGWKLELSPPAKAPDEAA